MSYISHRILNIISTFNFECWNNPSISWIINYLLWNHFDAAAPVYSRSTCSFCNFVASTDLRSYMWYYRSFWGQLIYSPIHAIFSCY